MARPRYVFGDGCGLCSEPAVCAIAGVPIGARCKAKIAGIMQSAGYRSREIAAYFAARQGVTINRVCVDCEKVFREPKRRGAPALRCVPCKQRHMTTHNRSRRARDRPRIEPIPLAGQHTAGAR